MLIGRGLETLDEDSRAISVLLAELREGYDGS